LCFLQETHIRLGKISRVKKEEGVIS